MPMERKLCDRCDESERKLYYNDDDDNEAAASEENRHNIKHYTRRKVCLCMLIQKVEDKLLSGVMLYKCQSCR